MKIAYQGIQGSYSETALKEYMEYVNPNEAYLAVGFSSFNEVLKKLETKEVDMAIIPIENSTTGLITRTMDLLKNTQFHIIYQWYLPIYHTLWGTKGSSLETIQKVYSHPEVLSQCKQFFNKYPNIEQIEYEDTAKAAWYIKEKNDISLAALSSTKAGELFDLVPLKKQMQSEKSNTTRFFIIKSGNVIEEDLKQFGYFYLETKHEKGALLQILKIFDILKCNLESLNSRPIENEQFKYGFYIEVDFSKLNVSFNVLLELLKQYCEKVQYFSSYSSFSKNNKEELK